ncbi:MAG: glycosyltransferase family 2 protein [Patescibacteria group bacterium]
METIIIPALNEAGRIELTLTKIFHYLKNKPDFEVIVVDNDSVDSTREVAMKFPVSLLECRTRGKALAMKAGATAAKGDILIFIDGDDTYEPDIIPHMIFELRKNHTRLVRANRFQSTQLSMSPLRRLGNRVISRFASSYFQVASTDVLSGFFGISKKDFLALNLSSTHFEIETEIYKKTTQLQWSTKDLPVAYSGRRSSNLKPFKDGWKIIKSILATS